MNRLEDAMMACADPSQAEGLKRFFKTGAGQYGEGDEFLGVKVPATRQVVKRLWREAEQREVEGCITSAYHEIRLAGLLTLVEKYRHSKDEKEKGNLVSLYLLYSDYANNWDLVDLTCYNLLGDWLLDKPERRDVLYRLAVDNKSIWRNRIAIVATMQFIRHGQLDDTYAIADLLLHHPHDLIHKAVGWLLREAGKRDEARLTDFLKTRYAAMPRTMLRYAIERMDEPARQAFLHGTI